MIHNFIKDDILSWFSLCLDQLNTMNKSALLLVILQNIYIYNVAVVIKYVYFNNLNNISKVKIHCTCKEKNLLNISWSTRMAEQDQLILFLIGGARITNTFLLLQIIHEYEKSPPRNPGLFDPEYWTAIISSP